jgi:hypothetical protein
VRCSVVSVQPSSVSWADNARNTHTRREFTIHPVQHCLWGPYNWTWSLFLIEPQPSAVDRHITAL